MPRTAALLAVALLTSSALHAVPARSALVVPDDRFQTGLVAFGATESAYSTLALGAAAFGQTRPLNVPIRVTTQELELGNGQSSIHIIYDTNNGQPFVMPGFQPNDEPMTGLAIGVGDAQGFADQLPFIPDPIDFIVPVALVSLEGAAFNNDGLVTSLFGFTSFTESFLPNGLAAGISQVDFFGVDITTLGINRLELTAVVEALAAPALPGDYNDSGSVEQGDLDLVLNNWGGPRTAGFVANADGFGTTNVDQEELDRVLNNWGTATASGATGLAVPEPATAGGLVCGLLSLWGRRKRRPIL